MHYVLQAYQEWIKSEYGGPNIGDSLLNFFNEYILCYKTMIMAKAKIFY